MSRKNKEEEIEQLRQMSRKQTGRPLSPQEVARQQQIAAEKEKEEKRARRKKKAIGAGVSIGVVGAAALGDIGKHFPDNDPEYEGADSLALLKRVGELLSEEGYVIENIDSTIIAQKPKMAPHIEQMRKNIADTLGLDITRVNVKATTEEGLGFTGAGEGISSQAAALIMSVENYIYDNIARGSFISSDSPAGGCAGCQGCRKNG